MAVDLYALCPCGSGKKLKFCCSDLVGEIEQIHRMLEGDQPRAALNHVKQALAQHPGRASLLDLKATLELSQGELDSARETIDQFLAAEPNNPSAHACQAMWLAATNDPPGAVKALQCAIALVDHDMPHRVFEAIGTVGRTLLAGGHVASAQAHLWFQVALSPAGDSRALEVLVRLNHYSGLPLLLREQLRFRPSPDDAAWKDQADEATRLADQGKWQQAVEIVDRLGREFGADPVLLYNRAVLAGWLADDRTLVAGLHAYAQLDVPHDDAVEAEALAQLLDSDLKGESCDTLLQVYEIRDEEALADRFAADRRIEAFEVDPQMMGDSDQPRPRQAYILLDRPMPESGTELTRHDVPHLAGVISIYGRQTDRPERLELTTDRGSHFEQVMASLQEITGDALGDMTEERVVNSVSATEQALNWRWHFPTDTPPAVRRRLAADERHAAIVERWPDVPAPALGDKTPRAATADAALRVPLSATVLILEQGSQFRDTAAFADLRKTLGLPQPEPIHPNAENVSRLPLVRVPRLVMEELSDDDLVQLHRRAMLTGFQAVVNYLDREAVRRPSVAKQIPPSEAYRRMIVAETDSQRTLALIEEARQHSIAIGESTATWDLAELELHLSEGSVEPAQTMLRKIEQQHMDDPQVASALYRLLYEMGMIPPEAMAAPASAAEAPPAMAAAQLPADQEPGRIWTPDGDRPSGGKSSLWTPS
jgi:tetratricopeptide (TPR) repeat protein